MDAHKEYHCDGCIERFLEGRLPHFHRGAKGRIISYMWVLQRVQYWCTVTFYSLLFVMGGHTVADSNHSDVAKRKTQNNTDFFEATLSGKRMLGRSKKGSIPRVGSSVFVFGAAHQH